MDFTPSDLWCCGCNNAWSLRKMSSTMGTTWGQQFRLVWKMLSCHTLGLLIASPDSTSRFKSPHTLSAYLFILPSLSLLVYAILVSFPSYLCYHLGPPGGPAAGSCTLMAMARFDSQAGSWELTLSAGQNVSGRAYSVKPMPKIETCGPSDLPWWPWTGSSQNNNNLYSHLA